MSESSYRINVQKTAEVFTTGRMTLLLDGWYYPTTHKGCIRTAAYVAEGFDISPDLHTDSRAYFKDSGKMTHEYDLGLSYEGEYQIKTNFSVEYLNGRADRLAVLAILREAGLTNATE